MPVLSLQRPMGREKKKTPRKESTHRELSNGECAPNKRGKTPRRPRCRGKRPRTVKTPKGRGTLCPGRKGYVWGKMLQETEIDWTGLAGAHRRLGRKSRILAKKHHLLGKVSIFISSNPRKGPPGFRGNGATKEKRKQFQRFRPASYNTVNPGKKVATVALRGRYWGGNHGSPAKQRTPYRTGGHVKAAR